MQRKLSGITSPARAARMVARVCYIPMVWWKVAAKGAKYRHSAENAPVARRRARSLWGRIRAFAAPRTVSSAITPAGDDYPPLESGEFAPLAGLARAGMWTVAA